MDNQTCTFFGHRDTPDSVKPIVKSAIIDLIENRNVVHFYLGNQGSFDSMVLSVLTEIQKAYSIRFDVVLAALPKKPYCFDNEISTILPEGIETVPPHYAIDRRNRWMVDHSDIIVTYVCRPFGGAAKFKDYAIKKAKTVIELSGP